jgi:hypothetical protein
MATLSLGDGIVRCGVEVGRGKRDDLQRYVERGLVRP